jgi:hypothetical protein
MAGISENKQENKRKDKTSKTKQVKHLVFD